MTSPIGDYLVEFRPSFGLPDASVAAFLPICATGREPAPIAETLADRLERSRREGLEEARRAAEASEKAALEAQATALATQHAALLEDERLRWATAEGGRLAESLAQGLSALEDRLADSLADVLQPFLAEAVRSKAVAEIRQGISSLLAGGCGRLIEVSGPADVVEVLRVAYADTGAVEIRVSEAPEVTVLADPTSIRTRMLAWTARLDDDLREGQ